MGYMPPDDETRQLLTTQLALLDQLDDEAKPFALYNLGILEARLGQIEGARKWLRLALATGQPLVVPPAAYLFGELANDANEADAFFCLAIEWSTLALEADKFLLRSLSGATNDPPAEQNLPSED